MTEKKKGKKFLVGENQKAESHISVGDKTVN